MFSIFHKNKGGDVGGETVSPDSTLPRKMDLEERKAFRRDMLDQVIRESLQALEVMPNMYRFRIMPLDTRHHRFIAMIDMAQDFQLRRSASAWNFHDIEVFIKKNAFERFGLLLEGIYWRVGAATSVGRSAVAGVVEGPSPYELVSDEEKQALMEAIREGAELPVLHVGEREYHSEMAPLDEHGRIDSSRYGAQD